MSEEALSESDLEPSLNSEDEELENEEEEDNEDMEEDGDENDGDDEDESIGEQWIISFSYSHTFIFSTNPAYSTFNLDNNGLCFIDFNHD